MTLSRRQATKLASRVEPCRREIIPKRSHRLRGAMSPELRRAGDRRTSAPRAKFFRKGKIFACCPRGEPPRVGAAGLRASLPPRKADDDRGRDRSGQEVAAPRGRSLGCSGAGRRSARPDFLEQSGRSSRIRPRCWLPRFDRPRGSWRQSGERSYARARRLFGLPRCV
jgi:hypothetical protein